MEMTRAELKKSGLKKIANSAAAQSHWHKKMNH
jgi:hypothetical protein